MRRKLEAQGDETRRCYFLRLCILSCLLRCSTDFKFLPPMKVAARLLVRHARFSTPLPTPSSSLPPLVTNLHSFSSSSSFSTVATPKILLTDDELNTANLLLPRLCESNHLQQAINLIHICLLANTPVSSLSLPIVVDRLCLQPDMTLTMSLLTKLKHTTHGQHALLPIAKLLVVDYFKKQRFKEGLKVFDKLSRPDSPSAPDAVLFAIVVRGLCKSGQLLETLRVLREMVLLSFVPSSDLQVVVFRGLLREARVKEARELNEVLGCFREGNVGIQEVVELLDRIIRDWRY